MVKKKIPRERRIDSFHKINIYRTKKPLSAKFIILLFFVLIIFLLLLLQQADYFKPNQATIVGIIGSTSISIFIFLSTLNHEKRDDYREARKSAKILSQLINSTYSQISRIEKMRFTITYPSNWLDYYKSCSIYLKYDYLEYLLREFEIIDKINDCIRDNNSEQLSQLLQYRKRSITDWTFDFDILSVQFNLSIFSLGGDEIKPWKFDEKYALFEKFFIKNYSVKTKELTVQFLKINGNSCSANDAEYYVMENIRTEAALKTGEFKFEALENKKMLSVIFKVYLTLKSDDPFSLIWGELTLQDNTRL